jgi:ABC-2 type transport system permease protein
MNLLSGSTTPMDSMPLWLQYVMVISPTPHFVALSQAILYRGAGWDAIWQQVVALIAVGVLFFVAALIRFRRALADAR